MSRLDRVNQWLLFMRQWYLIDATGQDAYKLGKKVAMHLAGKYKPIYHAETDCGDHVVVINCKDVAMKGFDWKHRFYFFNKEYPKARSFIPAWQIHEYDQCRIVSLAVYKELGNNLMRRVHIQRLHLFPDDKIPEVIKRNIGAQLEQVQAVPKRSDQYTEDERNKFPRLFKYPKDHFLDWEKPVGLYERYHSPKDEPK
uniref:39S ribosomal protein L13, mitochondrial n=1 Tax=Syphacia muris TaxID=451379 RepID=A0A0N5AVB1_9BILA